ncbi:fluoride efflux transporter CrcB [Alkalihalobacillus sp. CinArs1]|uniref:fluoride efflux transporter CrcB n=1 Tax=Alkalihalobacillus sp. CinArs1 TaxID=2995314 RepID=UPI0022DE04FB|nr:fluoride efflux transporter CrcB [Alkalihalobacillus sp. CinArs1]
MRYSFAVAVGGAVGALLRSTVGTMMNGVPFSTFLVNIIGSLLLGFFYRFIQNNTLSEWKKKLIATGLIGSFTTFSTYSLDLFVYLKAGQFMTAFLYGMGSVVLGLLAAVIGVFLAKRVRGE